MKLEEVQRQAIEIMKLKRFNVRDVSLIQHATTKEVRLIVELIPNSNQAKKLKEGALEYFTQKLT